MVQSHGAQAVVPDLLDAPMEQEFTEEEIQKLNAEYYQEMSQRRFEAQHGEFSSMTDALDLMKPADGCDLSQEMPTSTAQSSQK
eukprot:s2032_g18.t1